MILHLSERFGTENAIPDNQQIEPIAVIHIPYLNVLQLENRIRDYQQNDRLAGQHYPYLKFSKPENAITQQGETTNM